MKNLTSYFKLAAVIAVGFAFVACGKKDDSKTASTPGIAGNGIVAGCPTCTMAGAMNLFNGTAYGTQTTPISMSIQINGDGATMNQLSQMYPGTNLVGMYSGPIQVNFAMNVGQGVYFGMCQVAPGTYQLMSLAQGQMNRGYFNISSIVLTNNAGITLVFSLTNAVTVGGNGFGGTLKLQQMNSIQCNDWSGFTVAPE